MKLEGVNVLIYLLNRLPKSVLEGKTPFKVWFYFKTFVDHIKVFGSICHLHVSKANKGKLDERSKNGIFIGYSTNINGCRIYSP